MNGLDQCIGREHRLDEVARAVRAYVQHLRPAVSGAMLVTCSDESERECADAFQQGVVSDLLPSLKFARRASFRTATLGGRYEWGSVLLAEHHFATAASHRAFKVMVVKIHAHVSVREEGEETVFGRMSRYDKESAYCGALHALLEGQRGPAFLEQLRETFQSEGLDRIERLNDEEQVPAAYRSLYAAVVSARLQARMAFLEVQDRAPASPTHYLILPTVTLNRQRHDTELLCGIYQADRRTSSPVYTYRGLGDDPALYQMQGTGRALHVVGPGCEQVRDARDHRQIISQAARQHPTAQLAGHPKLIELAKHAHQRTADQTPSKPILQAMLLLVGELTPVPVALFLFGSGLAGIYHAFRAHRLAGAGKDREEAAERIIRDVQRSLETMSPEQADRTLEALLAYVAHVQPAA